MLKKALVIAFTVLVISLMGMPFLQKAQAQTTGAEAVTNGGFESGSTGWSMNYGTLEIFTANPHAGSKCAGDTLLDSMTGISFHQDFAVAVPAEHAGFFTFWLNSSGSIYVSVWLHYVLYGWDEYYLGDPMSYAGWTVINSTCTNVHPGDSIDGVQIDLNCMGGSNEVYIDDVSLTYGTGEGTSPSTSQWDAYIAGFVSFIVPLVIMMTPVFLLGMMMGFSKWGVIIGLAIGTGLGQVFVPGFPLWLTVLVSIGIVGFAWQSTRGGV